MCENSDNGSRSEWGRTRCAHAPSRWRPARHHADCSTDLKKQSSCKQAIVGQPRPHHPQSAVLPDAAELTRTRQLGLMGQPVLVLPRSPSGAAAALLCGPALRAGAPLFPALTPFSCKLKTLMRCLSERFCNACKKSGNPPSQKTRMSIGGAQPFYHTVKRGSSMTKPRRSQGVYKPCCNLGRASGSAPTPAAGHAGLGGSSGHSTAS